MDLKTEAKVLVFCIVSIERWRLVQASHVLAQICGQSFPPLGSTVLLRGSLVLHGTGSATTCASQHFLCLEVFSWFLYLSAHSSSRVELLAPCSRYLCPSLPFFETARVVNNHDTKVEKKQRLKCADPNRVLSHWWTTMIFFGEKSQRRQFFVVRSPRHLTTRHWCTIPCGWQRHAL